MRAPLLLALPLCSLSSACLVDHETYERRKAELSDGDGDGFTEAEGDCDDASAVVYPGAPELCDSFDNDCDGTIDEEDVSNDILWTYDLDGDGYGGGSTDPRPRCEDPGAGWVSQGGDCDDGDPTVFPGADELCDGVDNDCDDAADEEPSADPLRWYLDADGDGYGTDADAVDQCLSPGSAYVLEGEDCDDTDATTYPGADELCDAVDNDCDGEVDDPPLVGDGAWYPDEDGDGYGDDSASDAACAATEGYVDVPGDCDDSEASVNPEGTEACNDGLDNDCDGTTNDCVWDSSIDMSGEILVRPVYDKELLGWTSMVGDYDGDGMDELLVSADLASRTASGDQIGVVVGLELPITSSVDRDDADLEIWGDEDHGGFGTGIVADDFDGDGFDDLAIGHCCVDSGSDGAGRVHVFYGPVASNLDGPGSADWAIAGSGEDDSIGYRMYPVGDLDNDGLPDFAAGYEYLSEGAYETGGVYLFTDALTGSDDADSAASAFIYGSEENLELGLGFGGMDLDGDGMQDFVVGATRYADGDGAALVFQGPVSGELTDEDADIVLEGEGGFAGRKLSPVGDTNGDGIDDLLIGAPQMGDGAAYLVWGDSGLSDLDLADADKKWRGDHGMANFGWSMGEVGDLNQDGHVDLVVTEGAVTPNWVYLYWGPHDTADTQDASDADVILKGDSATDQDIEVAFSPGDVTGDSVPDLIVGSYKNGTDADGILYIVEGVGF